MSTCCNGANIAAGKRKRGRPPGMKNKPVFPVATCTPDAASLHPHVLEIPAGGDVAETIAAFARGCRIFGVCVLSASGRIAAAVLWEATPYPSTITFQGSFDLLSMTATFLPGRSEGSLAVTLAAPQGQVLGGVVAGPVVAAGNVVVVAATFASPSFRSFDAINKTSASILPVFAGEEWRGKSSPADTCDTEKSDGDMLEKYVEELEQCLVMSPAVDGFLIGDGGSEENTGLDTAGLAVYGNTSENYLKELESCLELPAEVGGASSGFGGGAEEKITGLEGYGGGTWEGNCFEEHYPNLQMVVGGAFEGSHDCCGELFSMDAFSVSGACLPPLY
ncbi:Putative DNA-binding protein ESCAROLA [Dendrobium catenatum]|uniref:DNA-binding protein ESCAROLA n=1 Tax=Dendrobium catenatum TaxID=906689 RepID=A0A2I0VYL4_9ASPA|nr:Putative DNA-binding protein ESCAROLA [Dendrobium catenatum]